MGTVTTMLLPQLPLLLLLSTALAQGPPKGLLPALEGPEDILCNICVDLVTDLDEFLTADTTEAEIVAWVEKVCSFLTAIVPEAVCKSLIEAQLPSIIDSLVNENLKPEEVCTTIGACTAPPPAKLRR